jgi:outer membrane protein assembly factor BamE (lipoprotein component of BamABCDE complex)
MNKRNVVFLIIAGALLAGTAYIAKRTFYLGIPFDATLWRDEVSLRNGVREEMADRLVGRHTLQGKTRAEVISLLGDPPPTDYFSDWDLVYLLGPERGFMSIDSEWLVVRFGQDGRVTECRIVRD